MAYPPEFGEEELKWKFERCVNDFTIKSVTASALSYLGAKMFFHKRYTTSIVMSGFGAAVGLAWFACEKEIQQSLRICKDGVDKVVVCEDCKKNMEERRKQREERNKEMEERKKRIEKQMHENSTSPVAVQ